MTEAANDKRQAIKRLADLPQWLTWKARPKDAACKICKQPPDPKYLRVRNPRTRFTCGRCADELARIAEAPQADCANLFARAAFIFETWDQGNPRAAYLMAATRKRLDPRTCVRISQQVNDLSLRKRWLEAKQNGDPLPRVHSAVAAHLSRHLSGGSVTFQSTPLKPTPGVARSCGKGGGL